MKKKKSDVKPRVWNCGEKLSSEFREEAQRALITQEGIEQLLLTEEDMEDYREWKEECLRFYDTSPSYFTPVWQISNGDAISNPCISVRDALSGRKLIFGMDRI